MIILAGIKNKKVYEKHFTSISKAYHYYLIHYSTLGDWMYYLKCCGTPLCMVKDEEVMTSIFSHVFKSACIITRESA